MEINNIAYFGFLVYDYLGIKLCLCIICLYFYVNFVTQDTVEHREEFSNNRGSNKFYR